MTSRLPHGDGHGPDGKGVVALVPGTAGESGLATVTDGGTVRLSAVSDADGSEHILSGSARPLTALGSAVVGDQCLLVGGSADGTVRVWDVDPRVFSPPANGIPVP
ncbi:WD40 repeat domain-containing protein [Streptomyces sp. NBC_01240]|uniref:WD40 repeat domain-containing protein n=1 Tax=Streptomyces sp. NBC_01240 TaxID=2903793 RepID=UPI002E11D50D|nr:WD40 repeat domain-containing protein [Streptomyces sp. NBC_01240]